MSTRKVTDALKKQIAGRQRFKCANKPGFTLTGLENYDCPLWKINDDDKGSFDESSYEIDHIIEHCISKNDNENNLQALCKNCHVVKTKRFMQRKNKDIKNSIKIDNSLSDNSINDEDSDEYDEEEITKELNEQDLDNIATKYGLKILKKVDGKYIGVILNKYAGFYYYYDNLEYEILHLINIDYYIDSFFIEGHQRFMNFHEIEKCTLKKKIYDYFGINEKKLNNMIKKLCKKNKTNEQFYYFGEALKKYTVTPNLNLDIYTFSDCMCNRVDNKDNINRC